MKSYSVDPRHHELVKKASEGIDRVIEYTLEKQELQDKVWSHLLKTLDEQCDEMCSLKHPSMLQQNDLVDNFDTDSFLHEIKDRCPLLYNVCKTVACPYKAQQRNLIKKEESKNPAVAMAIGILFKTRNKNLNLMQTLTYSYIHSFI